MYRMRNLGKGCCREPLGKRGRPPLWEPLVRRASPTLRTAGQGNSVAPCELLTKGASISTSLYPWRGFRIGNTSLAKGVCCWAWDLCPLSVPTLDTKLYTVFDIFVRGNKSRLHASCLFVLG
jgi:hypothetical protein